MLDIKHVLKSFRNYVCMIFASPIKDKTNKQQSFTLYQCLTLMILHCSVLWSPCWMHWVDFICPWCSGDSLCSRMLVLGKKTLQTGLINKHNYSNYFFSFLVLFIIKIYITIFASNAKEPSKSIYSPSNWEVNLLPTKGLQCIKTFPWLSCRKSH